MDRDLKGLSIISGFVMGVSYSLIFRLQRRIKMLEHKLSVVDQTQDKIITIMDAEFQKEVDERFEDITDNYDE
jgi:hypothetical protein